MDLITAETIPWLEYVNGDTNDTVHILHLPIASDSQGYDGAYHLTSAGRLSDPEIRIVQPSCV